MLRTRGYLPHLENPGATYFVTFRLAGTLPKSILEGICFERLDLIQETKRQDRELSNHELQRLKYLETTKIQDYLDKGFGECWLRDPRIAGLLVDSINHFESKRYVSHAWCIMPNHVHWVFTPTAIAESSQAASNLIAILHGLKSFTAHEANKILNRTGAFWSREYYDHAVRSDEELARLVDLHDSESSKSRILQELERMAMDGVQ